MSDALIIVEKISSPTVQVFHASVWRFGAVSGQPWGYRVNADFVDGVLKFKIGDRVVVDCKLNSDGTMSVMYTAGDGANRGTFRLITN